MEEDINATGKAIRNAIYYTTYDATNYATRLAIDSAIFDDIRDVSFITIYDPPFILTVNVTSDIIDSVINDLLKEIG